VLVGTLLERLAEDPGAAALLLDVDGTLAPIVARPELAVVPEETRAELERLARSYALVACVSGRTAEDAARVVGVSGVRYVGEHGLELEPAANEWADRLAAFATGVDRPSEQLLDMLLQELAGEGRGIMAATHDLDQARAWDRVLCLNRRMVAFGPPGEVLTPEVLAATYGAELVVVGEGAAVLPPHHHH